MSELASDNFDRANETPIAAPWASVTGLNTLDLNTNQVVNGGLGNNAGRYTGTSAPADQYSKTTLKIVPGTSDTGPGPACRMAGGAVTMYFVQCNTTEVKLYRVNASSFHTGTGAGNFATYSGDGAGAAVNDIIALEVTGTGATVTLVVKKNGSTIITATDTDALRLTSGDWGIWAGSAGSIGDCGVDNWSGGDFAGGSSSISPSVSPSASVSASPSPTPSPSSSVSASASASAAQLSIVERTVFTYVD